MPGMGGETFAQVGLANNQLTALGYDAAGNTTADGTNTYTTQRWSFALLLAW